MKRNSLNKKAPVSGKSRVKPDVKTMNQPKIQTAEQETTPSQALMDSELRYRRLFESAQDGILILDSETGAIDDVNPYLIDMLGYSREEFLKKKLWEVGAFRDVGESKFEFKVLQEQGFVRYENLPLRAKGGQLIQVEFVSNVYLAGGRYVIQCNIRNITDWFRVNEALQESEARYRGFFEDLPTAFLEEDFSAVKRRLNALQGEGITNFQEFFNSHPQVVAECAALVKVVDVNKAAMKLLGADKKEDLFEGLAGLLKTSRTRSFRRNWWTLQQAKPASDGKGGIEPLTTG